MKLVVAVIQPTKLPDVKRALFEADVRKMTVTNVIGCGQQGGYTESYRGSIIEVNLLKKIRIEIAVNENFVKPTIDAIIKGARTGNIGDGKIFILDLPQCIRIRTGEEGNEAIG
ncbi:MAG: P-II family nitrogen regulator [Fibrobacter sp.]|jgi:nitrogen regulatory protein P-II 2|nr:P-II family nitrogen regulator [Fibrobacter sp.]